MKSVIDAFGVYAIEASLLPELPDVLSLAVVGELDDEAVTRLAAESTACARERGGLETKLSVLTQSLKTLQRLDIQRPPGAL